MVTKLCVLMLRCVSISTISMHRPPCDLSSFQFFFSSTRVNLTSNASHRSSRGWATWGGRRVPSPSNIRNSPSLFPVVSGLYHSLYAATERRECRFERKVQEEKTAKTPLKSFRDPWEDTVLE
jgi:hypothetical protein